MTGKHYAVLASLAVGIGMHMMRANSWAALLSVQSVGEMVWITGTVLTALFVKPPDRVTVPRAPR